MKERLSVKELFIMGGALFSMHFGASCMLYPVTWGKESGTSTWLVYIGVLASGIILPLLGYFALARGNDNFFNIASCAGPKFGLFFVGITILVLGPFYVIPRMSAAAWSAIIQLTGWESSSMLPIILFNIIYYIVTYWFVSSRSQVADRIGKILFPVLIIIVVAVIFKSIITPISTTWTEPSFDGNPVLHGFLQGYATGDLQCALLFGLVVIQGIKNAGIKESCINRNLILVGLIGLGMLAVSHFGHMIAGANLGGTIDLSLSALYTEMVVQLMGSIGGIFFSIALIAAALTTAIGLTASTAGLWEISLKRQISYNKICMFTCIISCLMSVAGLDTLVTFLGPLLNACYPGAIVLTAYYCFMPQLLQKRRLFALKWAMISSLVMGALSMIYEEYTALLNIKVEWFENLYNMIPLASYSLSWLPVSIIVYVIAYLFGSKITGEVLLGNTTLTHTEI